MPPKNKISCPCTPSRMLLFFAFGRAPGPAAFAPAPRRAGNSFKSICLPDGQPTAKISQCIRVKLVADAPHRHDVAAAMAQVAAQHLDVGVNGAVLAVIVVVPHLLQDLL